MSADLLASRKRDSRTQHRRHTLTIARVPACDLVENHPPPLRALYFVHVAVMAPGMV
jgi:hypothetical protein